jgi:phosphomannomutase
MGEISLYKFRLENHKILRFGTSGLRDEDSKLTDMQVYISTKGFLNYISKKEKKEDINLINFDKVALAGDFRPSTNRIFLAVAIAIIEAGYEVDFCGKIPTPTLSLWGFTNNIPSIMVTGSHIPYGQNGIKFNNKNGEVLKEDENAILEEITKIREDEYKKSYKDSMFEKNGFFKEIIKMNQEQKILFILSKNSISENRINFLAEKLYIKRYKDAFGKILEGEKVVFYQQTAVGRELIPKVFESLGAQVFREDKLDEKNEFIALDTEDMNEWILEKMANLAVKNNCCICITTDGDSDRPAVLFVKKGINGKPSYKNGKLEYHYIKGDKLNVMAALLFKPDFIAAPISLNHKTLELLIKNGVEVKLTKIGSPHVIKAMHDRLKIEKDINEKNNIFVNEIDLLEKICLYGFEVNGGGILGSSKPLIEEIFNEVEERGNGKLRNLPTRDSVFPIICVLVLAKKRKIDLEDLFFNIFSNEYESYSHAGLVENVPMKITPGCERYNPEIGKQILDFFHPREKEIIQVIFDDTIILINHEEKLINSTEEITNRIIKIKEIIISYINELFEEEIDIKKINYLDGIRIYLSNDEIIHLRPSGNAAQFRIYVECSSLERALKIIEKSIKPESGVLIKLINDFIDGKIKIE